MLFHLPDYVILIDKEIQREKYLKPRKTLKLK